MEGSDAGVVQPVVAKQSGHHYSNAVVGVDDTVNSYKGQHTSGNQTRSQYHHPLLKPV